MNFKTFKNHWFYYAKLIEASSRLHRGLLEAFKNYWFYYAKLIEASSRLHRGFQKPLVLLYKTHRGSLEAFKNYWFYYAKLMEACSRLSKTIGFIIQNSSRLARGFVLAKQNMSHKQSKSQPEPH
jgi:hypothetical protein